MRNNVVGNILLFCALLIAAPSAFGQTVPTPTPTLGTLQPERGAWYNPAQPGTGYMFDVGSDGLWFVAFFHYTATGPATWLTMQGEFEPTTDTERISTGIIGRFRSPLFQGLGGQCLGCTYMAPTISASPFGSAEFRFFSATRGEFVYNGEATPIDAGSLLLRDPNRSLANILKGKWMVFIRNFRTETYLIADIVSTPTRTYTQRVGAQTPYPPPYTNQLKFSCGTRTNCAGVTDFAGTMDSGSIRFLEIDPLLFSVDTATGRFRAHPVFDANPGIGQPNDYYDGYFDVEVRNNGDEIYLRSTQISGNYFEYRLVRLASDFQPRRF